MNERVLRACRLERTDRRPVWLMRQAGRYLPEYREARKGRDVLSLSRDVEEAARLTALPVDRFGLDAAIVFADLSTTLEGLSVEVKMTENGGPRVSRPITDEWGLRSLGRFDPSRVSHVFETIRLARALLGGRVPVIGFAGAPYTLACYLSCGAPSRDFAALRALMHRRPAFWGRLMETLTEAITAYLEGQVRAGAGLVQLFDSWAGGLPPEDYRDYALPYARDVVRSVKGLGVPVIYFSTCTAGMLRLLKATGADVISLDWRVEIGRAWREIGHDVAIQGNLDPAVLLADRERIASRALRILEATDGRPGHIFNLGHGVLPETPPENVAALVEIVHSHGDEGVREGAAQRRLPEEEG